MGEGGGGQRVKKETIRQGAKPINRRQFTEDCEYGDQVRFIDGPPDVQRGQETVKAPDAVGTVSMFLTGWACVRFESGGDPRTVFPGQRIERLKGYK
jgi:hypothetical protein